MRRHELLSVTPQAWQTMLQAYPGLAAIPLVEDWASHAWPVIVRRHMPDDQPGSLPVALPLPPLYGKRRVGFCLASEFGLKPLPPVSLRDAATSAPAAWQPIISTLLKLGNRLGSTPNVFGALLWQHATGLTYISENSDIDLLWNIADQKAAKRIVAGLLDIDLESPLRIDGELQLPDGGGVNWRELSQVLAGTYEEVLVKRMDSVSACEIAALFVAGPTHAPAISTRQTI